ncbi:MAG: hypothetical protein A4E19_09770 [Nitrospira sp. SG-bin1]|nr:MAG: hypothetical protein A4E19_09770 [Nitrospira sp. SG-bin1]
MVLVNKNEKDSLIKQRSDQQTQCQSVATFNHPYPLDTPRQYMKIVSVDGQVGAGMCSEKAGKFLEVS